MAEIKRGRSESDWKEQSRGRKKKKKARPSRENRKTEREQEHKLCHHVSLCKSSNVCLIPDSPLNIHTPGISCKHTLSFHESPTHTSSI